jgi:dihydrofolate reductase
VKQAVQVTIQAAISVDGFIATPDGDTDWVKDLELYEQACREYGCMIMGRTTYDEYAGPAFDGVQHIVLTSKPQESRHDNVHFVQTVEQAMAKAKELGFDKLLVIGGGQTNGSFMRAGVVGQLMLDVHPIVLGQGKKLLGDFDRQVQLRHTSTKEYPNFVCLSYDVT